MVNKVRVYGKAQNRTALGIVNAYLVMYPHATLSDLRKAFPDSLNPDSGVKINFVDLKEMKDSQPGGWDGFFSKEDEVMHLADGTDVALVKMWTKPSFERLVQMAANYGIEIAEFTAADKGIGRKGGYRLEYLNGYVPPVPEEPEKKKSFLPLILGAGAIALAAAGWFLLGNGKSEPEVIVKTDTVTVVKTDTVYVQQVEEIEKNFNAAQFEQGKADLNDAAKFALHDLAKLMNQHEDLKVSIVGHTSAEGDAQKNQQLSEARAKAAVDFLVSQGVDEKRLKFEGKGSSEPIDPANPVVNRRTEFIVE